MTDIFKINQSTRVKQGAITLGQGNSRFSNVNPDRYDTNFANTDNVLGQTPQTRFVEIAVVAPDEDISDSDIAYFLVPSSLNGFRITAFKAMNVVAGNSDTTEVEMLRTRNAVRVSVGTCVIAANETLGSSSPTSNNDLQTNDLLQFQVDVVPDDIKPQGLIVLIEMAK